MNDEKLIIRKLKEIIQVIRPRISLRFWEGEGDLSTIATIHDKWWDTVNKWLNWLPQQVDMETAPLPIVNIVAYQRDIKRFYGEPEAMYRKRVKYAFLNARDAGTMAGFYRIWERLELGSLEQNERLEDQDWDIIELVVDDKIFSRYQHLFELIIRKYGRTCRRYILSTRIYQEMGARAFSFSLSADNTLAKPNTNTRMGIRGFQFCFGANNTLAKAKGSAT